MRLQLSLLTLIVSIVVAVASGGVDDVVEENHPKVAHQRLLQQAQQAQASVRGVPVEVTETVNDQPRRRRRRRREKETTSQHKKLKQRIETII